MVKEVGQFVYPFGKRDIRIGSQVVTEAIDRSRPLAWIGIVASILGITGTLPGLVIPDLLIILTGGILIMMLYEIVLGIWLLRSRNEQNH